MNCLTHVWTQPMLTYYSDDCLTAPLNAVTDDQRSSTVVEDAGHRTLPPAQSTPISCPRGSGSRKI